MNFDALIKPIVDAGGGVVGIILLVMLWFNYTLVKKLFEVIKSNSEVITGVKNSLDQTNEIISVNTEKLNSHSICDQRHIDQCERTHKEVHEIKILATDTNSQVEQIYNKLAKAN